MSENNSYQTVVGPSHCVRLQHAMTSGQLPLFGDQDSPLAYVGIGGMPIWSPRIWKELGDAKKAFFLVGDFRFGNAVLKVHGDGESLPAQEYLAVEKPLINEENDRRMFDLCRHAVRALAQEKKGSRFLFWDLSIREFENRSAQRYQLEGVYRHPVWNFSDVLEEFQDVAIDSSDLLEWGGRTYIDSSGHPSLLGWIYILQHVRGKKVDLPALITRFDRALVSLLEEIFAGKKILVTGDSKFMRILDRYVKSGLFVLPAGSLVMPVPQALKAEGFDHCLYFPPTTTHLLGTDEIRSQVANVKHLAGQLRKRHGNLSVLFYDNWALECVSRRQDYLNAYVCKHDEGRTPQLEQAVCDAAQTYRMTENRSFEGLLELNNTLLPTTLGLLTILGRSVSGLDETRITQMYRSLVESIDQ